MSPWLNRHLGVVLGVLTGLVVLSLALVALLFSQLAGTRDDLERVEAGSLIFASQVQAFQQGLAGLSPVIGEGLDDAIAQLEAFGDSTIEFDVAVDETVAIDTTVVLDRDITVPIHESLPIQQTIETTITVDAPLGLTIPVDVTVPIDLIVPIDLDIEIPVRATIPIVTEVPVHIEIPVRIEVRDTGLATLTDSLASSLTALQQVLAGLGG